MLHRGGAQEGKPATRKEVGFTKKEFIREEGKRGTILRDPM